jgi:hypothetical protein
MDLPVCEIPKMREKYTESILLNVKRIVGEIFGKKKEALALRPRSWKEPHMLLYQAVDGKPHHTGIEMHYDGCDITWQAMLTRNDEYEGGGTYFRCLRKTILLRQGQVLVHPGAFLGFGILCYAPLIYHTHCFFLSTLTVLQASCIIKGLILLTAFDASWSASQMDSRPRFSTIPRLKTTTLNMRKTLFCMVVTENPDVVYEY